MKLAIAALAIVALTGPALAQHQNQHHQTPYAGLQQRPVKALSDQQLADLRAGRGMGLALAGELNGYPGPLHVIELADQLAAQRRAAPARSKTVRGDESRSHGGRRDVDRAGKAARSRIRRAADFVRELEPADVADRRNAGEAARRPSQISSHDGRASQHASAASLRAAARLSQLRQRPASRRFRSPGTARPARCRFAMSQKPSPMTMRSALPISSAWRCPAMAALGQDAQRLIFEAASIAAGGGRSDFAKRSRFSCTHHPRTEAD